MMLKNKPLIKTTLILLFVLIFTNCNFLGDDIRTLRYRATDGIVPGANLEEKFAWLMHNALSDHSYIIEVYTDESIGQKTLDGWSMGIDKDRWYGNALSNVTVTLKGIGAERTISNNSWGEMFLVREGVVLVLGENIYLSTDDSSITMISINPGGRLVMNNGSTIIGGVQVSGGSFIMNGGAISALYYVVSVGSEQSSFVMNGGVISGAWNNGVSVAGGSFTMNGGTINGIYYAGVNLQGGSFIMNGGSINDNGSGVMVGWLTNDGNVSAVNGTFIMNGGIISGSEAFGVTVLSWMGGITGITGIFNIKGGTVYGNGSDVNPANLRNSSGSLSVTSGAIAAFGSENTPFPSGDTLRTITGTGVQ